MSGRTFQFPLDPVLQLRTRAVDDAREALARAVRARTDAEAALASAETALAAHGSQAAVRVTAWDLGGVAARHVVGVRAAGAARRVLDRCRSSETRARRALAETVRAHEAVATLRTEAAEAHRAERARVEGAALDDLAVLRHAA